MSEPFLGQITLFPYTFPPKNWADCAGQLLSISQFTALFSLLGTSFGGNGTQTFGLPNLQGAIPVRQGALAGGSSYLMGEAGGAEVVSITSGTMAIHGHALNATTARASGNTPSGTIFANAEGGTPPLLDKGEIYNAAGTDTTLVPTSIAPAGGTMPHNNIQPFLVLRYCIALQGIVPQRA
jgi:microcystin-dependent protein